MTYVYYRYMKGGIDAGGLSARHIFRFAFGNIQTDVGPQKSAQEHP